MRGEPPKSNIRTEIWVTQILRNGFFFLQDVIIFHVCESPRQDHFIQRFIQYYIFHSKAALDTIINM